MYYNTFNYQSLLICLLLLAMPLYGQSTEAEKAESKTQAAEKGPKHPLLEVQDVEIILPLDEGGEGESPTDKSRKKKSKEDKSWKEELQKNAEAYLEILEKQDDPNLTEAWIRHLHKQAVAEIQASLQPFGYYNVTVDSPPPEQNDKGTWVVAYVVKTGPRTKITDLNVSFLGVGDEQPELQKMIQEFPIKVGDPVLHSAFDQAKNTLLEGASLLGYVDVIAEESKLIIYPEKNTAEIKLQLQTGEKYYIGDIQLHQDVLNPDFVMRYLEGVHPGDPYSQAGMLSIQRDFIESGYFSLVDVNPDFDKTEDYRVPIDVTLAPANRQKFSFGLGYDTDILINLNARWQHRRLNKAGHHADVLMKLSVKESRLQGSYWVPIKDPRTHKIGYTAKYVYEKTDSTERSTFDLEMGYYYKWRDWISKLFTEIKNERYTAGQEDEESINVVSIGASMDRVAFENAIYPRRGWQLYTELRGSPGLIFENSAYIRAHLKSKVYLPVFSGGRLILRGELGTATVQDFDLYPLSLRFFAGGDNSVRGYEWKSLGPTDEFGEVIGGSHVVTGSFEYNHQVAESWLAAVFVDAGNAYDNEFDELYVGAGFGARWLSPVGIVRVDLAWPMDDEVGSSSVNSMRLHIGFEVNL